MLRQVIFVSAIVMALAPAEAAEAVDPMAASTVVDALEPIVQMIVGAAVTAFLTWLSIRLNGWFGIAIDAKSRETLHSALTTAANMMVARAAADGSARLKDGLDHVMAGAGDAIQRFGLDAPRLETMLQAKIQQIDPDGGVRLAEGRVVSAEPKRSS